MGPHREFLKSVTALDLDLPKSHADAEIICFVQIHATKCAVAMYTPFSTDHIIKCKDEVFYS